MSRKSGMPWDQAIEKVLDEAQKPMRYTDIATAIADCGLRPSEEMGATPANTVNSCLHQDKLKNKVFRVGTGVYILKKHLESWSNANPTGMSQEDSEPDEDNGMGDALITGYGRFWSRDVWTNNEMNLYGTSAKTKGAACVDFTRHAGIYLLHKGYEVVYVGQAQELYKRLKDHTNDDKRNRWDNFSWFSISDINDGQPSEEKKDLSKTLDGSALLDTLEALLIEVLGPERNKKVGNEFEDKEFEQLSKTEYLERKLKFSR